MILLIIVLSIFLYIAWLLNNKDVFAPSFIFCASFLFSSVWATAYINTWNLNLRLNTFLVISGGTLLFITISYFVHLVMYRKNKLQVDKQAEIISIERWKYLIFIVFEIIVILLVIRSLKNITKIYGASDLSNAIFLYRYHSVNGTLKMNFPGYILWLRSAVSAAGYWFAYTFSNKLINKRKIPFLDLVVIILAMVNSSLLGGRNGIVNMIISVCVCSYFILVRNHAFAFKFKFKNILKLVFMATIVLYLFQFIGELLGRNSVTQSSVSMVDYLAKYCGAPIKNLDIFLSEKNTYWTSQNNQTFIYLVHWFGGKFGLFTDYVLDLPYQKVNGFNLGNVYSIFYPFIYDYGYFGVIWLTSIMALICQCFYELVKRFYNTSKNIFYTVTYGYIFSSLIFSFFSNKFYEQHFSYGFFRTIIFWLLFDLFFIRLKITERGILKIKIKY